MKLIDYVKQNEGLRLEVYQDQFGKWTIGYGHTGPDVTATTEKITKEQAEVFLMADLAKAAEGAINVIGRDAWQALNIVRRNVLTDMVFQMGTGGVSKFVRTMRHVQRGEWHDAAAAMLQSLWASQTPNRAARNIAMMLTGLYVVG